MVPFLPGAPLVCRSLREAASTTLGALAGRSGCLGLHNVADNEPTLREAAPAVSDTLAPFPAGTKDPSALREAVLTGSVTVGVSLSTSPPSSLRADHRLEISTGLVA